MHMPTWNRVFFGALAIINLGLGADALAGGGGKKGADFIDREIKMMDTNGDQQVNADEHAVGARKMFETMDSNKDGKVTATEMDAAHARMMGEKAGKAELSSAEKIKTCDTDNDGALTLEEHGKGAEKMFGAMDVNKDGQLSRTELVSGHGKFLHKDGHTK